jgi:hypothetical protein
VEEFDTDDMTVTLKPAAGHTVNEIHELLTKIKDESAVDPLWRGVADIKDTADGVAVTFRGRIDPHLTTAAGRDVACLLYTSDTATDVPGQVVQKQ